MYSSRVSYKSGKLSQEIAVGRHRLVTDEPLDLGGEDTGPSPLELLASALAACTAITMRLYAQRKAWPLLDAIVVVNLEKTPTGAKILRTIDLRGELSQEQKTRLMEIAERCPVHKVLSGKIEIETSTGTPG